MTLEHVIGIDGGGTQTVGLLVDLDGNLQSRAVTGPSNFHTVGMPITVRRLADLLQTLWEISPDTPSEGCRAICCGLAGLGRAVDRALLRDALAEISLPVTPILTHDAHTALLAGTEGTPGTLLISGTGSITFALDEEGEEHRIGGWGPLLADRGSGYAIGRAALRAMMREWDVRRHLSALAVDILEELELANLDELVRWGGDATQSAVARLAPVVCSAAWNGDAVARGILDRAADDLAEMIHQIRSQWPQAERSPVILSGGVFQHQPRLVTMLRSRLASFRLDLLAKEPAWGAIWLVQLHHPRVHNDGRD